MGFSGLQGFGRWGGGVSTPGFGEASGGGGEIRCFVRVLVAGLRVVWASGALVFRV